MIGAGSSLATFLFFFGFLSLGSSSEAYSVIFCNFQKMSKRFMIFDLAFFMMYVYTCMCGFILIHIDFTYNGK